MALTGVGKTETALALSDELGRPLFRIDMSEFQLHESVNELLGHSGQKGRFELAREKMGNGGILLLDEIEKAHPLVLDLLLQILDAARITLRGGHRINFSNDYIILTSNIGAADAMTARRMNETMFRNAILQRVKRELRSEIYNRILGKVVFRALEPEDQFSIAELVVRGVCLRLEARGWNVRIDAKALQLIKELGIDRYQGARPLRTVAEDLIEYAVATAVVEGADPSGELTRDGMSHELCYVRNNAERAQ